MKKILVILGIFTLLCVNCVFADDTVTVYDTINNAVNNSDLSMGNTFTSIFQDVIDWCETPGNISGFDMTSQKYIIYPTEVLDWAPGSDTYRIQFNLAYIINDASGTWGVITVPNGQSVPTGSLPAWFGNNNIFYYDLVIGYTNSNGVTNYEVMRESDGSITANIYSPAQDVDHSNLWRLTYKDNNDLIWLVANQKTGLYNKYGVTGSVYYSDPYFGTTRLPCFDNYYVGRDTGNWFSRYQQNSDQYITPVSKTTDYGNNSISSVTITDNSIVVEGSDFTPQETDSIDNIWNGLKGTVTSLIALLTGLGTIFRLIFSWLPNELIGLISSLLIFCGIYLVIKALRGG